MWTADLLTTIEALIRFTRGANTSAAWDHEREQLTLRLGLLLTVAHSAFFAILAMSHSPWMSFRACTQPLKLPRK